MRWDSPGGTSSDPPPCQVPQCLCNTVSVSLFARGALAVLPWLPLLGDTLHVSVTMSLLYHLPLGGRGDCGHIKERARSWDSHPMGCAWRGRKRGGFPRDNLFLSLQSLEMALTSL